MNNSGIPHTITNRWLQVLQAIKKIEMAKEIYFEW